MKIWQDCCNFGKSVTFAKIFENRCTQLFFSASKISAKPIYSYTGGSSVACLAPWHAYVRGRAEEDQPRGVGLLWKPNWHELDTEGLLAWCGNIHVMLQPNWGIARLECR